MTATTLVYTWVSIELFAALERGYRLLDVYEVWHFPETTQYDKAMGAGGIFAKYIDVFSKIKQESSGYPDWCKTDIDKEKFVKLSSGGRNCTGTCGKE